MNRGGRSAAADSNGVAKNMLTVRNWVSLDCTGRSTVLDVDKHVIMRRAQIHARDLRIIDPLLSYPSAILGRERAIVLNLEHIKAIITAEEVLLRDPSEENVIPVLQELHHRLPANFAHHAEGEAIGHYGVTEVNGFESRRYQWSCPLQAPPSPRRPLGQKALYDLPPFYMLWGRGVSGKRMPNNELPPFEFRALEVALEAICHWLDARTKELEASAYPILDELTCKISSVNLDKVRRLKSTTTRLTASVQKVRDEIEQLLEDDNDMANLYLSRKMATESPRLDDSQTVNSPFLISKSPKISKASVATNQGSDYNVEELEMLLELREYVDDTEDYINLQHDNHRNQLIQLELFLSACTVSLTFYSLVGGIFGMNIPFSWNDNHEYIFNWVVTIGGLISALILVTVLAFARFKGLIGS
ncbi:magnesium transporter MRS2-I-like isoform X2 [Zingiber officinale]|uniref:magnesium transporter MRS2-I-like isoform X2 n=1 Tax=Zingiber officinale TaxID=94328 RepID=UPI001C4C3E79|nr:magnesium transporter MRS2-I-like isoform X2 [Zingiber officinale]